MSGTECWAALSNISDLPSQVSLAEVDDAHTRGPTDWQEVEVACPGGKVHHRSPRRPIRGIGAAAVQHLRLLMRDVRRYRYFPAVEVISPMR